MTQHDCLVQKPHGVVWQFVTPLTESLLSGNVVHGLYAQKYFDMLNSAGMQIYPNCNTANVGTWAAANVGDRFALAFSSASLEKVFVHFSLPCCDCRFHFKAQRHVDINVCSCAT